MLLQSPLHVAVNVTNLAAAEHFYGTLLGLPKVDRALKFPGAWYQIGSFQIHLIVRDPLDNVFPLPLPPTAKWGRYPHMAFAIADLALITDTLTAAGIPIQASASGRAALFVQDPDGNLLELAQLASSVKGSVSA